MVPTAQLVSVEEYLHTSYPDGDREYVDGVVVERNLGELPHSDVQRELIFFFLESTRQGTGVVYPEQRVQVSPTRYRVPDICVCLERRRGLIIDTPPFLVVEIISREDRVTDLQEKIEDYLNFGVPYIWVIDPWRKCAYIHTTANGYQVKDGFLRTENPAFVLPLAQLFA